MSERIPHARFSVALDKIANSGGNEFERELFPFEYRCTVRGDYTRASFDGHGPVPIYALMRAISQIDVRKDDERPKEERSAELQRLIGERRQTLDLVITTLRRVVLAASINEAWNPRATLGEPEVKRLLDEIERLDKEITTL